MTFPLLLAIALMQQDTVTLARVHAAAISRDQRLSQPTLAANASHARVAEMLLERKPQFAVHVEATHQSAVTGLPTALSGGASGPPKDRFQATLNVEQLLYDAGVRNGRIRVENSRLEETTATLATARYAVHADVNQAFFAAWTAQVRAADLEAIAADYGGRLLAARARLLQGAGLPRDTAQFDAERLTTLRKRDDALADRAAALDVLRSLTGLQIDSSALLVLPALDNQISPLSENAVLDSLRGRPEFAQMQRTQDRLAAEALQTSAINRPRVVAFGQTGLGRPGLNQFDRDPALFWTAGVRLEWRPFTWHSADLSAQAIEAQRRSVAIDANELSEQLSRAAATDLARIRRLQAAVQVDDRVVALRQVVEAGARAQFDEGVITASEYLTVSTALLEARLADVADRAESTRLQATLLTTLGLPLR